jgi:hypothetical protein
MPLTLLTMEQKKLNVVMAEVILAEQKAATREGREASSTNVINSFQELTGWELSRDQAGKLFEAVFTEFCRVTGVSVSRIDGQKLGTN